MHEKLFWDNKVGPQGIPNPGPILSFQPTATNSDQILEFVIFLYSGIYPSHKTIVLGQKI